jgi:hypothetical protein
VKRVPLLVRFHWILAWRQPSGSRHENLMFKILFIPLFLFIGFTMIFSMQFLGRTIATSSPYHLNLFLIGLGGFLSAALILSLLLEKNSTMFFDFSRLFHYPVTPGEIVVAQILGYTINPMATGFPIVMFFGVTLGIALAGKFLLALAALAGTCLWVLQISLVFTAGELVRFHARRSARVGRIVLLVACVLGMVAMVGWILIEGSPLQERLVRSFTATARWLWHANRFWIILLPGISPLAWVAGGLLNFYALPAAVAEAAGLYWIATPMLRRLMVEGTEAVRDAARTPRKPWSERPVAPWERLVWWPSFVKEFRNLIRERYNLVGVGSLVVMACVVPKAVEAMGPYGETFLRYGLPCILAGLAGLGTLNQFGFEAPTISRLFISPAPRWTFIWAKNLMGMLLLLVLLGIPETYRLFCGAGFWTVGAEFLLAFGGILVLAGIGNIYGILLPYPAAIPGKNLFPQVSQKRLLVVNLFQIVYMGIAGYAMMPLLAGRLALSVFGRGGGAWWAAAAAMALYACGLYAILLPLAGRILLRLEPHVFEKLQKSNA